MTFILKSPEYEIRISEASVHKKYSRNAPRIERCDIESETFDRKFPILTFGVGRGNELKITIHFTHKRDFEFSVDPYLFLLGKKISPHQTGNTVKEFTVARDFQLDLKGMHPEAAGLYNSGIVLWFGGNPIGLFCKDEDLDTPELSANSLNIFGKDFTCNLETGKTERSEITDKSILEGMKQHVASVQVQFMKKLTSEFDHMIHSFKNMEEHMRMKMHDNDERMDVRLSEIIDLLKTKSPEHSQPCDCPTDSKEAMTERISSCRDTLMKAAIPGHPCAYIV